MVPGARSKFGAPMFETKVIRKQMCCIERSTCHIVWTFRRPSRYAPAGQGYLTCDNGYFGQNECCACRCLSIAQQSICLWWNCRISSNYCGILRTIVRKFSTGGLTFWNVINLRSAVLHNSIWVGLELCLGDKRPWWRDWTYSAGTRLLRTCWSLARGMNFDLNTSFNYIKWPPVSLLSIDVTGRIRSNNMKQWNTFYPVFFFLPRDPTPASSRTATASHPRHTVPHDFTIDPYLRSNLVSQNQKSSSNNSSLVDFIAS